MDFMLTDVQRGFAAASRRYLEDRYPAGRIAELADTGDRDLGAWPALERRGWLDPGLGPVELTLLAEESGRALHPAPWLVTAALATPAFHAADATPPGPATFADGSVTCLAAHDGDGWRLNGEVADVVDVAAARELVVAAQTEKGLALFAARLADPGATVTVDRTLDPLRGSGDVLLRRVPARLLVDSPAAQPMLQRLAYRASLLFAAEGVGVADRALAFAVRHAGTRDQATGYSLAESYADVESARSLVYRAAGVLAGGREHPGEAVACAIHASRLAAVHVCENAVQVIGGVGVTWEHPLHWWYRRALWLDAYHAGRPDPLEMLSKVLLR